MKTENKIYNFFIVIALLFWNPLSFYLLYKDTPIVSMKLIWSMYIILFFAGIIIIWMILKNKIEKKLKDIILSFIFFGILLGIVFSINIGLEEDVNVPQKIEQGLIFPKNQIVTSKTSEYDFKVITNSIGIRDREINIDKKDKYRILCFGDSWTMGFGVNVEYSWPRRLHDYFVENEFNNIEVINCGRQGQYTTKYLEYMNKAIPLLKPDLVLIGVLQLDDLAQLYERNNKKSKNEDKVSIKEKIEYSITTYGEYSIRNILRKSSQKKSIDLKNNYINSVQDEITKYDYSQKKQYKLLPDSVKQMFESGNLNPSLLNLYVNFTYRNIVFNNPTHPATKLTIRLMNHDIKEMKTLCNKNDSDLIFINLPTADFTGHKVLRTPNDSFNCFFEKNNNIDSIYQNIAIRNELTYLELTNHFIELKPKNKFFFKFDGHPNQNGYNEIARYIGKELIKQRIITL